MLTTKDPNGKSYIEYVLDLISSVLDPSAAEAGATSIGKLISTMVAKCGQQLQENNILNQILTACLKKLEKAETVSVQQTLLLVFSQLMCENVEAVLNFTNSVNATNFLLKLMVEKYNDFFGFLERKIGAIGLVNLLKYMTENNSQDLMSLTVNGDQIIQNKNTKGRVTRNRAQKECIEISYQQIPLIVKLYKILLQEFQTQFDRLNNNPLEKLTESDGSEDDEWVEDDEDIENINPNSSQNSEGKESGFLSAGDVLNGGLNFIDDDEDFFDEFEKADNPFGNVDVMDYMKGNMKSIPVNGDILNSLSNLEKKAFESLTC